MKSYRGKLIGMLTFLVTLIGVSGIADAETLTLEQVIREVCTKSDSVKMMKESVKKAEEMVQEKWANAMPVIAASATGAKSRGSAMGGSASSSGSSRSLAKTAASDESIAGSTPPDPRYVTWAQLGDMFKAFSEPQTSTIYSAGVSVTQPIFTFGKVGTAIKVAKMFNESARLSYDRNLQTLQLQAIDAFYGLYLAEKNLDIANRTQERKLELNEFVNRNFELGSGSRAQVLNTKADVALQSSQVIIAKKNVDYARMGLIFITGRSFDDSVVLDTAPIPEALSEPLAVQQQETIKEALADRLDIKTLALLAESNRGGAKIFRSMYLPSIAAFGSAGWSKYESGAKLFENDGMANWMIGVGASWTLFDGFASSAKAAQYFHDAEKLDLYKKMLEKGVEMEITSAVLESKAADSFVVAQQEAFIAARESYDLTYENFKQGSGNLNELQRVDAMLQGAELGLINARYRQIRSRAALLVAMGKDIITIDREDRQ